MGVFGAVDNGNIFGQQSGIPHGQAGNGHQERGIGLFNQIVIDVETFFNMVVSRAGETRSDF